VLEEPGFWGHAVDVGTGRETFRGGREVFLGHVFEGTEGDETDGIAERCGIEVGGGGSRVAPETPADFVGHPVADAGAGVLIEKEGLKRFLGVFFDELADAHQGEFGILWLWREGEPRGGDLVKHDAPEHAVVIENERGVAGLQDEMVVFVSFVVERGGGKFTGHSEVDFEVESGIEGEKHPLAVRLGRLEGFSFKDTQGGRRTVTVNPGLRMCFDPGDGIAVEGGPLAACEFDFGEFGHGARLKRIGRFEIGIWHGMRYGRVSGRRDDDLDGGERPRRDLAGPR